MTVRLLAINCSYFLHDIHINFFVALLILKVKLLHFSFIIETGVNTKLSNCAINNSISENLLGWRIIMKPMDIFIKHIKITCSFL